MIATSGFDFEVLAVVAGCVTVWGLVADRLTRLNVSAPIAFVLMGVLATHGPWSVIHVGIESGTLRTMAELALALVLFSDASRVNLSELRHDAAVPARLLGIGLPLTIALGAGLAALVLPGYGLWVAALIGAIVAPTDAALGAAFVIDERIPSGVRRIINVESGLNDGIATPFVNFFLAGALAAEAVRGQSAHEAIIDLAGGLGLGVAVGVAGAVATMLARRTKWTDPAMTRLAVLALALLSFALANVAGVNAFVAAFVAGMAFGTIQRGDDDPEILTEEIGSLFSWLVWFAFGAIMLVPGFEAANWRTVVFALLALTVVRMVPVAICLIGGGLSRATVGVIGWFGPRGLATIVFGLLAVDSLQDRESSLVLGVMTVTVAMSVIAHGISAGPLARRFGPLMAAADLDQREHSDAPRIRTRSRGVIGANRERRRANQ
jgi:NhaP-type Na+/H+ or K+/H+ antiporter